jgi:thioredoxin reductase (NADPH)
MPMSEEAAPATYDAVIIGGGPAGLTAAIYLARSLRSVAVFDCDRPARSDWVQVNHNYLGFPDGISIVDLGKRGRAQAEQYGARFYETEATSISRLDGEFEVTADQHKLCGRAVILATGVTDNWVEFPGYKEFIGRSMHWCIVCDGYEMQGQRVLVVGDDEHAAQVAMQMERFTNDVSLLVRMEAPEMDQRLRQALSARGIRVISGEIATVRAREPGVFAAVVLAGGEEIEVDHLFSEQGARPNVALAESIGIDLTDDGYFRVDTEARTSMAGIYAAGDVTRLFSHQVVTAAHEGATAATSLAHDLFAAENDVR